MAPENAHRLLVVDDDAVVRFVVRDILRAAGYAVDEAVDGQEAWELLESEIGAFDAVVSDVRMPRMSGLELVEKVRALAPDLPIVLLTGLGDKETIKMALRLGVNEFVEKPLDPSQLCERIAELLSGSSTSRERRRHQETVKAVQRAHGVLAAAETEGLPLDVRHKACTDAGGDVFRCQRCEDTSLLFILADVAGHSVESSYAVASFLGTFAAHGSEREDLLELLGKLNAEIQRGPFPDLAVCATVGRWCPWNGRLHLASAGLPHARLWRRQADAVEPIVLNGTPLGYFPEPLAEERVLLLQEGDRVLLGTDGVFEARSPGGVLFEDEIDRCWREGRDLPVGEALDAMRLAAQAWSGGESEDDLLVVGLVQPPKTERPGEWALDRASTFEEVDYLCERLRAFLSSDAMPFGVTEAAAFDVEMAAREALANAVQHGNIGNAGARVALRCWPYGKTLCVAVTDEGPGLDLGSAASPDDDLRERSRGIPLMRQLADRLSVIPGEVRLVFNLWEGSGVDD